MNPHRSPKTESLSLLLPVVLLCACSETSKEVSDPSKVTPNATATEDPTRPPQTFDELLGIDSSESLQTTENHSLPKLKFESNSGALPTEGTWREHPSLCDLDGDGKADLIASNREETGLSVWRSVPGKDWELKRAGIPDTLMYGGSDCADLDGDGDIDILFAAHKQGLHTLINDGSMGWSVTPSTNGRTFLALDVALGNLNGDEHMDAATIAQFVDRGKGALGIYFGKGDGTFEYQESYRNSTGKSRNGVQVELADLDGNGLDDIFLTAEWSCQILMSHMDDSGQLNLEDRSQGLPPPPFNMGNSLRSFIPMDVDGDGVLEVAFASLCDQTVPRENRYSLGVCRWNEDAQTWEAFGSGLPDGLAYTDVLTADFNGDTHSDLLVIGPGLGAVIYLGDGKGDFQPAGMLEGTMDGGRAAIGDIDGDGKPDVTVINTDTKFRPEAGGVMTFLNRDEAW